MNTNLITAILSTVLVTNSFIQWPKRVSGLQPSINVYNLAELTTARVQSGPCVVQYEDDTSSHARLQVTEVRRITTLKLTTGQSFEVSNVVVFSTNYAEELVWTRSVSQNPTNFTMGTNITITTNPPIFVPSIRLGEGITNVGPMIILGEGIIAITNKDSIVLRYTGTNFPN